MNEPALFERVAVIGCGLIGSSIARAVRATGAAGAVAGHDTDAGACAIANELAIFDALHDEPADAVAGADLVVLCAPVGTYAAIGAAIAGALAPGTIVSDVGSVKRAVIDTLGPLLPAGVHLVPAHPVAGTEHSGPAAGFAELFHDRWCILTPPEDADRAAVERLAALWRRLGSDVEIMDALHHDRVLAITSHLPHLIAYTITATAADLEGQLQRRAADADPHKVTTAEVIKYSAGGFRDFTRIAGSDPVMWRDVFLNNREPVLEMLGRFSEDLAALQRAIRWGEGETLHELFTRTRDIRRSVVEAGQAGRFQYTENSEDDD